MDEERSQPRSLRELVELALEHQGTTYNTELERRARARGKKLSNALISQYRRGIYPGMPERETLEALAELAGVGYEVAVQAAGVRVAEPTSYSPPPDVDTLDLRRRELLAAITVELIRAQRMEDERDDPTPDFEYLTDADRAAPDLLGGNGQTGDSSMG